MRRFAFTVCLFFACFPGLMAQVSTSRPTYESQGTKKVSIDGIIITQDFTLVYMTYSEGMLGGGFIEMKPDTKFIALGGKREFKLLRTENIPVYPDSLIVKAKQKVQFRLYFEKIEPGIELLDLFECVSTDRWTCFNFYGIKINNPALPEPPPVVVIPPPTRNPNRKPDNKKIPATPPVPSAPPKIIVTGKVLDANTRKPIAARVVFELLPAQTPFDSVNTKSATGAYSIELPPQKFYSYLASAKGYLPAEENLDIRLKAEARTVQKDILLKPLEVGQTIRLNNIYFPQGEFTLLSASFAELDRLTKGLRDNPTLEIMLEGHTDIIGNPQDNLTLSQNRVRVVKEYLVKKGIAEKRIQVQAYGGTQPIKTDGTDEERQINRRVEFNILKK
jgi:OmpA-OmpF porin, OOP family